MTTAPDWDTWFSDTHGGTEEQPITSDDDECDSVLEDDYSEDTFGDIEEEPPELDGSFFIR